MTMIINKNTGKYYRLDYSHYSYSHGSYHVYDIIYYYTYKNVYNA